MGSTKSVSTEGIYMVSLNLTSEQRSSSEAVRVLSLVPKSIPISLVIDEILSDVKQGMTVGYEDYDANGDKVVIFLDMVGCIGDTPALNQVLDVKGHTAIACCHLCRFRRLDRDEIEVGRGKTKITLCKPRYMGVDIHGGVAYASRSNIVHQCLKSVQLDPTSCKRLGIRENSFVSFMQFLRETEDISSIGHLITTLQTVVHPYFDPYRSLLVAPDHLLFGLAKDSINAVLSVLPDNSYVTAFELAARSYLIDARLKTQKAIVNKYTKTLSTISISEVFPLLMISEEAFRTAFMIVNCSPREDNWKITTVCLRAVGLIGSLARICARIWFRPRLFEDGIDVIRRFNANHGVSYLRETQAQVEVHIRLMRDVCTYKNKDIDEYKRLGKANDAISKRRRNGIEKELRSVGTIVQVLDCPNVHRLLEMAHVYLPMIGTSSRLSELGFEKAHQSLKRSIENSNNHNPHLQAISANVCNDWQGRIAMLFSRIEGNKIVSLERRGVIRLLLGREHIARRNGTLTAKDNVDLNHALGMDGVVKHLLELCGGKVMRHASKECGTTFWVGISDKIDNISYYPQLEGNAPFQFSVTERQMTASDSNFIANYNHIIVRGIFILREYYANSNPKLLNRVFPRQYNSGNRRPEREIIPGDVIQVVGPRSSLHSPVTRSFSIDMNVKDARVQHYYILNLFEIDGHYEALVLPCVQCEQDSQNDDHPQHQDRMTFPNHRIYKILSDPSYVKTINLSDACHRVFVQHLCGKSCIPTEELEDDSITHREHPIATRFVVRNREEGFPPRSS